MTDAPHYQESRIDDEPILGAVLTLPDGRTSADALGKGAGEPAPDQRQEPRGTLLQAARFLSFLARRRLRGTAGHDDTARRAGAAATTLGAGRALGESTPQPQASLNRLAAESL